MNTFKCTNCNNLIPTESLFCPFCGQKQEPLDNKVSCNNCNNIIPPDSEFCPFCGTNINTIVSNVNATNKIDPNSDFIDTTKQKNFDFSDLDQKYQKTASRNFKHIKLPDDQILTIGNITSKKISFKFLLYFIPYYVIFFIINILTHNVDVRGRWSNIEDSFFLFFMHYKHVSGKDVTYFWGIIILFVLICLIVCAIPLLISYIVSFKISKSELVLTNKYIFYYSATDREQYRIPLDKIKSINCRSCPYFFNANQIEIVIDDEVSYFISGLSNAQPFIQAAIKATQKLNKQ